jgi:hypothetical protein
MNNVHLVLDLVNSMDLRQLEIFRAANIADLVQGCDLLWVQAVRFKVYARLLIQVIENTNMGFHYCAQVYKHEAERMIAPLLCEVS